MKKIVLFALALLSAIAFYGQNVAAGEDSRPELLFVTATLRVPDNTRMYLPEGYAAIKGYCTTVIGNGSGSQIFVVMGRTSVMLSPLKLSGEADLGHEQKMLPVAVTSPGSSKSLVEIKIECRKLP